MEALHTGTVNKKECTYGTDPLNKCSQHPQPPLALCGYPNLLNIQGHGSTDKAHSLLMLQTNTGSPPSLMPLPPLQPCLLLCSFLHHPHLHLSAITFLSFKLQLRCDLSNCSHPFPWPHLHPDTVFLSPLSPESSPQALWVFFFWLIYL